MLSLEDRVQNGIFLLDMTVVGWDEKVDVDILDLSNCVTCVLGQLVGWESHNFNDLLSNVDFAMKCLILGRCGFARMRHLLKDDYPLDRCGNYLFFLQLTNVWKKAILERRAIRAIIQDMEEFAKN